MTTSSTTTEIPTVGKTYLNGDLVIPNVPLPTITPESIIESIPSSSSGGI